MTPCSTWSLTWLRPTPPHSPKNYRCVDRPHVTPLDKPDRPPWYVFACFSCERYFHRVLTPCCLFHFFPPMFLLVIPQLQFLSLLSEIDWWSVRCSKCVRSTQVSVFSLCSLILGPQPPPQIPNPPHTHMCGPGGAGACCPEDRGSAGSQKHLSVPLPLHCNPAGTALSSAPAVCKCAWMCVCAREERRLNDWLQ